nr:hypothetical protein [Tanacetum cinerariifolium]
MLSLQELRNRKPYPFSSSSTIPKLRFDFPYSASLGNDPGRSAKSVFHRRVDIKDHSFSPNSKIELLLFNSNNYISNMKKRSPQDERNFAIFLHFKNNEIGRKGLRVYKDSFAYKEYGIRLMLHQGSSSSSSLSKLTGVLELFWLSLGLSGGL